MFAIDCGCLHLVDGLCNLTASLNLPENEHLVSSLRTSFSPSEIQFLSIASTASPENGQKLPGGAKWKECKSIYTVLRRKLS